MPSSKLRWIHRCPVSRRNFTKICFNSGPISLSNSRCQRNLGIKEWTHITAQSVPRQHDECNMKPVTPSKKWSKTTKCAPMESSFPHSSAHVSLGLRGTDHWQDLSTHQKHLAVDRGSFVGTKMIVFTRWKHANFCVGYLRRQRKIWFSSHFWVSISSSFRKLTILNFNLAD